MIRTKIVCTLGPACDGDDKIRAMIQAGMSVARVGGNAQKKAMKRVAGRLRLE